MIDTTKIKLIPIDTRSQEEKNKEIDHHLIYGLEPVVWVEKPQTAWSRVTQRNQDGSSSCVDHSEAEVIEKQLGVVVSAQPLYSVRANKPEEGSIPNLAIQDLQNKGTALESVCPSNNLNETQMDAPVTVPTPIKSQGSGGIIVDPEHLAYAIETHGAIIMSFNLSWAEWLANPGCPKVIEGATIDGGHELSGQDFSVYVSENCIIAQNHWGEKDNLSVNESGLVVLTPEYIAARCTSAYYIIAPKQMNKTQFLSFYTGTPYEVSAAACYDAVLAALTEVGIYSPLTLIGALATVRTEVGRMYLPVREDIAPALANQEYNGILGNVIGSNDGYAYRGGGLIQLTGRANYEKTGTEIGIDLIDNPDLTLDLATSAKILAQFFKDNEVNTACDASNWMRVRTLVNGIGSNNLPNGWTLFNSIISQFMTVMN